VPVDEERALIVVAVPGEDEIGPGGFERGQGVLAHESLRE